MLWYAMLVEQVEMAERGTAFLSCATASNIVRFPDKESHWRWKTAEAVISISLRCCAQRNAILCFTPPSFLPLTLQRYIPCVSVGSCRRAADSIPCASMWHSQNLPSFPRRRVVMAEEVGLGSGETWEKKRFLFFLSFLLSFVDGTTNERLRPCRLSVCRGRTPPKYSEKKRESLCDCGTWDVGRASATCIMLWRQRTPANFK